MIYKLQYEPVVFTGIDEHGTSCYRQDWDSLRFGISWTFACGRLRLYLKMWRLCGYESICFKKNCGSKWNHFFFLMEKTT